MAKRKPRKDGGAAVSGRAASDERVPQLLGLFCFFIAFFLCLAFVSYCFTWKYDQDKVLQFSWSILLQQDLQMQNWFGRLGAVVSHQFFYWGFGVASFSFIYFLVQFGRKLLIPGAVNFFRLIQDVLLVLIVVPPFLHFALHWLSGFPWGGAFGRAIVDWLHPFLGTFGLILLFLFVFAGIAVWYRSAAVRYLSARPSFTFRRKRSEEDISTAPADEPSELRTIVKPDLRQPNSIDDVTDQPAPGLPEEDLEDLLTIEHVPEKKQSPEPFVQQGQSIVLEGQTEISLDRDSGMLRPSGDDDDDMEVEIAQPASVQNYIEDVQAEDEESGDLEPYDPTSELAGYVPPSLELLESYDDQAIEVDRGELEANKNQIIATLSNYKIEITKIRATIGPTVTLYEIVPAPGVRISKIKNLEDDIALSLAALGIRIIAPIPGKGTIGIEVPNKKKQIVSLREVVQSDKFRHAGMELPIALGKTIANEVFVADLSKMPHLLIAGATGQGKSVGINAVLMSLLYKKHPSQVKLVLIDPKKVELSIYGKLDNHFLAFLPNEDEPIITETKKVINTLNSLCIEMDTRYDLLKKANARNILEYNAKYIARRLNPEKGHKYLPYIILVVDEFADLIMTAGKEVEMPIARLAQLARAIGIHLIIATQRPSVNIITGVIKANFPARIAFKVTSQVDSKTILDRSGANQLIGRGDMLLSVGGDMVRLQCAFVDTPEVERTIDHIAAQRGNPVPFFLPEYVGPDEAGDGSSQYQAADLDEFFEDAARLVVQNQQGSTSMIQRRMKLGYNRAGRIMDQLEAFGIVGPNEGSKAREVLFHDEFELEKHLDQIRAQR